MLTERRPRTVRLPRREVDFLLASARHVIDVTPTFARGAYQLTPRGYVGYLTGPTVRYTIGPKIPWPNLQLLLGLHQGPAGDAHEPENGLLAVLATAFSERLEAVARAGLVAGYGETETVSPFLRGKLRTAAQMRSAATRAFPGHFHINEPIFDLNTPWNQIPTATATALLRRPELPLPLRERIAFAALPLATVAAAPVTEAAFAAAFAEPRAANYRPLLDLCRIIHYGFAAHDPLGDNGNAFLIDLGQAFERYLAVALERACASRPLWAVEAQPRFTLGPTVLQPDILLRKNRAARVALDAKWKITALEAADLHQVLAYSVLAGAPRVGLVYPGRTDARTHFTTADGKVRVTRYRVRVVGTSAELGTSITQLARDVCRSVPPA